MQFASAVIKECANCEVVHLERFFYSIPYSTKFWWEKTLADSIM